MRVRRLAALAAVAATLSVAGCTEIPSSSTPEVVVTRIGAASPSGSLISTPIPGADPRTIVGDFLEASATDDPSHAAARGFLTAEGKNRWQDNTVTVLDSFKISNFGNGSVTLTGRPIGTVSSTGIYTPTLQGDGTGGAPISYSFIMKQVAGQWRIDSLHNGIFVTADRFEQLYEQHTLYFLDQSGQHVVPDPRYTALTDPALLANWLVAQMVSGPRPDLSDVVTSVLPAQTSGASRVVVTIGSPTTIEFPGSSTLDPQTRNGLAAQLGLTLNQVPVVGDMTIVDTGGPVTIPLTGSARFSASSFDAEVKPAVHVPSLFYIRGGGVVDETGKQLPGTVGNGTYGLTSAALANGSSGDLRVAGVSGSGAKARLLVGTVSTGLRATNVRGVLSRPAWAPDGSEVWVGNGSAVLRADVSGKVTPVQVAANTAVTGSVTALRFSPEGSRVAMVVTAADGTAQVWIGSVVRSPAQVRIDALDPITPPGIAIKDVAWNDPLKLFVIGRVRGPSDEGNVYEVQVDGSLWTPRNITNLPQDPDSIAVAENQLAWVSAGTTVWVQRAGSWASPGVSPTSGEVHGTNPVYLE